MERNSLNDKSLDELSTIARAGDSQAESALFGTLRVRFLEIAKRRVRKDDAEDVVQDALRIAHMRYTQREIRSGMLSWSLVVLRNVIGNYYQKRGRLDRGETFDDRLHGSLGTGRMGADEDLVAREATRAVLEAAARLGRREPRCGSFFRHVLESLGEGGDAGEITGRAMAQLRADFPGMSRGSLYVAIHRCRNRLREILRQMSGGDGS